DRHQDHDVTPRCPAVIVIRFVMIMMRMLVPLPDRVLVCMVVVAYRARRVSVSAGGAVLVRGDRLDGVQVGGLFLSGVVMHVVVAMMGVCMLGHRRCRS